MKLVLVFLAFVSSSAFGTTCEEKVTLAVQGNLRAVEEYEVTATRVDKFIDNDGDTQLYKVKIDAGVDGGGFETVDVVTSGQYGGACVIKGIFGF